MGDLKEYKEAWKHQKHDDKQVDRDTITKMIHRRSSSTVKWIFYISIIEFAVLTLVNIFSKTDWNELGLEALGLYHFMNGVSIIVGFIIPLLFIYLFYRNYKKISVTSTTKDLIQSILKTRKTVKYYILSVISIVAFTLLYSTFVILKSPEYADILTGYSIDGHILAWIVVGIFILFAIGLILLFYLLLYGFLIRRLNRNYKELTSN